ncbi:probable rRNA-processing protein EBP2 [Hydractinia symbiolongicarpus]|uniref:probable rRNA-processing protein EBP2 n=1 Tax=Hydractinia symbiolongicarpus TaxID=13093 RepID=UPI00254B0A3C|nr:probable rRNA-processing protein EBP2 [Hydractinia symbiolongicarpus]
MMAHFQKKMGKDRKTEEFVSDDDTDEEEVVLGKKTRELYNNPEAMEAKLKQMKTDLDWLQCMDITTDLKDVNIPGVEKNDTKGVQTDIQDDFKREMLFYCQAQMAAKEALSRLRSLDIPTERPDDYFAEMVKTDVHMQKIRQKLLDRKTSMEKSEKAKKQRQLKKIGKKVQQDVLQKRQQEKKKMLETVDRIKKGKEKFNDFHKRNDDDMFNVSKEDKRSGQKRKRKDEKFGFGGKKRKVKKNSADSSSDMTSFKSHLHGKAKNVNKQKFGNKNSKNVKSKRLGKSRRMQSRGKK